MAEEYCPVVNLENLDLQSYVQGDKYEARDGFVGDLLKLTQLGAVYTEVPPGKSACPFHVHHIEDELFFVLEGRGEYRFGDKIYAVTAGDVLGAPRGGPEYAHQLTNTGDTLLKYLILSSKSDTEICEYPDSGKFMVRRHSNGSDEGFRHVGRQTNALDYWDGEET